MRRVSRGAVFWGSALVTAGLVILAVQQGLIDEALLGDIGQWWPLLLIGAGVAIVFAGMLGVVAVALSGVLLGLLVGGLVSGAAGGLAVGCASEETGPLAAVEEGSFSGSGPDVQFDLNCLTLDVVAEDGDDWAVEADETAADGLQLSAGDDRLELRDEDDVTVGTEDRGHVAVSIPRDAGASIGLSVNAGEVNLDLSDGQWSELDLTGNAIAMEVDLSGAAADEVTVTMNAGSTRVQLSQDSDIGSPMQLSANAGSFEVCAPDDLGLAITISANVAIGHNLDDLGLNEDGDTWRTDGFDTADNRVEITFSGNAASFTLNPEEGCS